MGEGRAALFLAVTIVVVGTAASLVLNPDDGDDGTEGAGLGAYLVLAYARVTRTGALDSSRRALLFAFVQDQPGSTFTQVRSALGLENGAAAHHLNVLERLGLIHSECKGRHRWYYPDGHGLAERQLHLSSLQASMVEHARSNPGIGLRELARAIDRHPSSVAYNVKALVLDGALRSVRDGTRLRIFAAEGGPGAPNRTGPNDLAGFRLAKGV